MRDEQLPPHDPETGEVIEQEEIFEQELETDKHYREAQKFLGLIEAFDIEAEGMEKNLQEAKTEILEDLEVVDEVPEELNSSLIESDELLSDFILVRQSLRDDIKATRILLKKLSEDMSASHADDLSGSMVLAYAELKKGNVTSMKLLMDSYSSVAKTQLDVKKLITEMKSIEDKEESDKEGSTYVQNNFIGTTADVLAKLKGGS
jgi:predicted transcriptional regulator